MDNEEDEGEEESTKWPIIYQIEKNKGLTPKRSKLYRNPRVRHRKVS
jgi:U3 small nucleolar RNA-associated protein 3